MKTAVRVTLTIVLWCAAPLWGAASSPAPELVLQTGHTLKINCVAVRPDGAWFVSGGADGKIKLWDAVTKRELRSFAGHSGGVKALAISPDGQWLVSGGNDGAARLWNVVNGQGSVLFSNPETAFEAVAFSPDGHWLATGDAAGKIYLWDWTTRRLSQTWAAHNGPVTALAFSPEGRLLASGSADTTLKLWRNAAPAWPLVRVYQKHTDTVSVLAFSPDSRALASASRDKTVRVWATDAGRERRSWATGGPLIVALTFTAPDVLLTANTRHLLQYRNLADGKETAANGPAAETDEVTSAALGRDLYVFGLGDSTLDLLAVSAKTPAQPLRSYTNGFYSVAFSPDGRWLAAGGNDHEVSLWDVAAGRECLRLKGHVGWVTSLAFTPDGNYLAAGSVSGAVKVWDTMGGREVFNANFSRSGISAVAFSPDGRWLAAGGTERLIKVWAWPGPSEPRALSGHEGEITALAFSADSRRLASASVDKTVRLWNLDTPSGPPAVIANEAGPLYATAFSPDGRWLAFGGAAQTVTLWDTTTQQPARAWRGFNDAVQAVAFSPDSAQLAAGSSDQSIKLWNIASGAETATLKGHTARVGSLSYTQDNAWLISGSDDGSLQLWRSAGGPPAATLAVLSECGMRNAECGLEKNLSPTPGVPTGRNPQSAIRIPGSDWLVVTPDGLFDGSPAAWGRLLWRFNQDSFRVAPVEAFFNEFFYPTLLADILAGKAPRATQDIAAKDRRQAGLQLSVVSPDNANKERTVTLRLEIRAAAPDAAFTQPGTARDLRLFRNGLLVHIWRGDVLPGQTQRALEITVPLVGGDNEFSAYAFNADNIKTADATLSLKGPFTRQPTLYLLTMGINRYANENYNLKYATSDAQFFGSVIAQMQQPLRQFERVVTVSLLDQEATKRNILLALARLSGNQPDLPPDAPTTLASLAAAQPEDTVIIYYAGHGLNEDSHFYMIPHDLGYAGRRADFDAQALATVLSHSISDQELETALESLDVSRLLLVLDACHSGQALESSEKRRGPMNAKGLAQLAYEKGMYILTAAQSYQAALEAAKLGHGYLTYALVQDGLQSRQADRNPADGDIIAPELLEFATWRVPQMQSTEQPSPTEPKRQIGLGEPVGDGTRTGTKQKTDVQRPRVFYRQGLETAPLLLTRR